MTVGDRRTSVRLEPDLWDALADIARRENRSLHEICTEIDRTRGDVRLTSAMRIYIVNYFRAAARAPRSRPADRRASRGRQSPV